ncbi:MAG: pyridoxal-phosphate dependent enzyme [Candidatus Bathyarchaeota archaeon]|nr:pyridoxal-phosphate dependent enzyme [Candidatus Bathyarchaeota archaeon]
MRPLIFEAYPGLESLPWMELGEFPTPVHRLEAFGESVGFPELYIKRDDMSSSLYGGNKVRKLEFIFADARRKRRGLLITLGAVGSNQVAAMGVFGREAGFGVMGVMMHQLNADYVRRNLLLDHRTGVEIKYSSNMVGEFLLFAYQYAKSYLLGRKPYYVPAGGSSPIGNLGFVNAAFELKSQVDEGLLPEPDHIIVVAGSVGTAAGLELGCRLTGMKTRVVGVSIAMPWYTTLKRFAGMVNRICVFMREYDPSVPLVRCSEEDLILTNDYIGGGYSAYTEAGVETVKRVGELEGIPLDNTYTGKALGGGLDWLKRRGLQEGVVLFWNTVNSVDFSHMIEGVDYRELPGSVHRYFEEPTQEELLTAS